VVAGRVAEGKVAAAVVVGQLAAVTAEVTAVVKAARERKGAMMAAALMAARKRRWPSQLGTLRSPRTLTPTGTAHRHQQHEAAVEMAPPSMARSRCSRCKVRNHCTRFLARHRRRCHLRRGKRYFRLPCRRYRYRMREPCPPGTQNSRCGSWCWCMWRRICRRGSIRRPSQSLLNHTSLGSFQTRRSHMQATRCRTQRSSQRSEHPCRC